MLIIKSQRGAVYFINVKSIYKEYAYRSGYSTTNDVYINDSDGITKYNIGCYNSEEKAQALINDIFSTLREYLSVDIIYDVREFDKRMD